MKLLRIAWRGLRGRKRDTGLLFLAVTLSLLFLVLSTTVLSSMEFTEARQRRLLYGEWKVMASDLYQEEADRLLSSASGVKMHIVGKSEEYGAVGSMEEGFAELGNVRLAEGCLPEKADEIAIERSRLLESGADLHAGDTVRISYTVELPLSEEGAQRNYELQTQALEGNRQREREAYEEVKASGEAEEAIRILLAGGSLPNPLAQGVVGSGSKDYDMDWIRRQYADMQSGGGFEDPISMDELTLFCGLPRNTFSSRFDELTPEEQELFLEVYVPHLLSMNRWKRVRLGMEEKSTLLGYEDVAVRVYAREERELGTYEAATVLIQKDYTLSGILESFTDRWDTGAVQLPGAYISAEGADLCEKALEVVYERFPYLEPYHPRQYLVFLGGGEQEPEALLETVRPVCGELLAQRPVRYDVQYSRTEDGGTSASFVAVEDDTGYARTISFTGQGSEWTFSVTSSAGVSQEITLTGSDLADGQFEIPGFSPPGQSMAGGDDAQTGGGGILRINRSAYPEEGERSFLMLLIVGVLFLVSTAAVLQIFVTQLRRRTRRIALLRALGMTTGQTAQMLFWEFAVTFAVTLPAGLILGMLGVYGSFAVMNRSRPAEEMIRLLVRPETMLLSVGAWTLALLLGMAVPAAFALAVPLTGRMTAPSRPKARVGARGSGRMTFFALVRRSLRVNRIRTRGNILLSSLICAVAVLCVYLGYASFGDYRTEVLWADKPDYVLTLPAAVHVHSVEALKKELKKLGLEEIERTDVVNAGRNVPFRYEGIEESPLVRGLQAESDSLPEDLKNSIVEKTEDGMVSVTTDVYTLEPDSELFQRILANAEGDLDPEAFETGEEVVLFLPLFQVKEGRALASPDSGVLEAAEAPDRMRLLLEQGGKTLLSAHSWMEEGVRKEDTVRPGDEVSVLGMRVTVGEERVLQERTRLDARVGAVLYSFRETGLWPVTEHMRGFTVIASDAFLKKVYPTSLITYRYDSMAAYNNGMNEVYYQDTMGRTMFQLYTSAGAGSEETDLALKKFAREHAMVFDAWRESKQKEYRLARNTMLLAAFLGFSAVVLSMLILNHSVASGLEAERNRMGILQSMGITRVRFLLQQGYAGFLYACLGLAAAHVVWLLAVCIFTLLLGGGAVVNAASFFACLAQEALWQYPWGIHAIICLLCAILCVSLQVTPMFRLLRYKPMENIRSR